MPVNQFKLKKGMFAKEFRQPELTLERADLGDGSNVFVQRGVPLRLGGACLHTLTQLLAWRHRSREPAHTPLHAVS